MEGRSRELRWLGLLALLVGLGLFARFHGAVDDPHAEIPLTLSSEASSHASEASPPRLADRRFVVWAIARNARAILRHPWRLFDAEQCYPAPGALALGEPALALGLLGVPPQLASGDPVLTFNAVLLGIHALAALAVFLIVGRWTGLPAAGVVAGLLYALHPVRDANTVTLYLVDNLWFVLALWFAQRLLERPRWSDAAGLAIFAAVQLGGSFYALLGSALLALPLVIAWLAWQGLRPLPWRHLAAVAAVLGAAAAWLLGPYLSLEATGTLTDRPFQVFLPLGALRPGGAAFPGWTVLGLATVALVAGRRRAVGTRLFDPRWALAAGTLIALNVAANGNVADQIAAVARGEPPPPPLPSLYPLLAALVPGLDVVRGPGSIFLGTLLGLALLAGLGAAALLRVVPANRRRFLAAALIALAWVDSTRPAWLGFEPAVRYTPVRVRPDEAAIAFFATLEDLGDSGPVLELPPPPPVAGAQSGAVLLSAYHHRRTSACYASFRPPVLDDVDAAARALPSLDALSRLAGYGFRTLVVHHGPGSLAGASYRRRVARVAAGHPDRLRLLYTDGARSAFAIERGP